MKCFFNFVTITVSFVLSNYVMAHHAIVSTYDVQKTTSVQGVVTKFLFKNPHARVYFDVTNSDGTVTQWVGDGSASTILRREGWDSKTLEAGDFIQIIGSSSRDASPMVMMDSVSLLNQDGSIANEIYGSVEDFNLTYDAELIEVPLESEKGIPNLTGIWTGQGSPFTPPRGLEPALTETGAALQATYDITTDPQVFCDTPGIVRQGGMTPHGVKITQYKDKIVFDYEEYGISHTAYFDVALPNSGIKTHMGDSVARYEDGSLIVETNNLLSEQMHAGSYRMSDQATVVQTYTRVDQADTSSLLEIKTKISDPLHYAEDFEFTNTLSSIETSWAGPPNYVSYEVGFRKTGSGDDYETISVTDPKHTFFGLEVCTDYDIRVRSICDFALGEYREFVEKTQCFTDAKEAEAGIYEWNVFPNPFSDQLNTDVILAESSDLRIEITALNGQVLLQKDMGYLSAGQHFIQLDVQANWPTGMYMVRVVTSEGSAVQRVIKG